MGANSVKLDTAALDVEPTNPIPSTGHVTIENSYNSSGYTDVIQSPDDCTSRDSSICSFSMDEIQQAISDLDKTIEKPLANQNPHKARNSPTTSPIPHLSLEEQLEAEESIINEFSPREVSREQDISAKLGTVSECGHSSNQDSVNSVHSKLKQDMAAKSRDSSFHVSGDFNVQGGRVDYTSTEESLMNSILKTVQTDTDLL